MKSQKRLGPQLIISMSAVVCKVLCKGKAGTQEEIKDSSDFTFETIFLSSVRVEFPKKYTERSLPTGGRWRRPREPAAPGPLHGDARGKRVSDLGPSAAWARRFPGGADAQPFPLCLRPHELPLSFSRRGSRT